MLQCAPLEGNHLTTNHRLKFGHFCLSNRRREPNCVEWPQCRVASGTYRFRKKTQHHQRAILRLLIIPQNSQEVLPIRLIFLFSRRRSCSLTIMALSAYRNSVWKPPCSTQRLLELCCQSSKMIDVQLGSDYVAIAKEL